MPEITVRDIVYLFEEAARTDRRLPRAFKKPKTTATWLETKQEKMYQHSWNKNELVVRPTARQIDRWWIASTLLREVVENIELKRIIWSKAKRFPWSQIARFVGVDRRKVKKMWEEEIMYIRLWLQLQEKNKKINDIIDKIVIHKR